MQDREIVIKGLKDLRRYLEDKEWSDKKAGAYFETITDAIDLLKKQEQFADPKTMYEELMGGN